MRSTRNFEQGEFLGVVTLGLLGLLFIYPEILISFSLPYLIFFFRGSFCFLGGFRGGGGEI